ncbi:MotA/TolQ/ExbB proton channel family protein [Emcibacteraceae bacterium]|nr:MotA/TolQ/ExbB proton channel family protein [Emcibacteraceae bacterium]
MIKPQKYLNRTIFFLIGVIIVCAFLFPTMQSAFETNPGLNGLIALVLIAGIIISMRQTYTLIPAVHWLENFKKADGTEPAGDAPELLGAMAKMMDEQRDKKMSLSTMSMNTLLDGIASRMDEGREITRYIIGLLIFLGLLGTFWGLLGTIGSIGDTINSLQVSSGDISLMFEDLKEGLAAPLAGMGTAFSSSLFGLAGSVVLGFIDLQTGQAQGRFFNHLEDWLSSITKLSSASSNIGIEAGDASVPAYVSALLEESADSLDSLHKVIARSEENKTEVNKAITNLSVQLSSLVDHQAEMRSVMKQMVTHLAAGSDGNADVSEKHLRNIDVQLKTLTDETIKSQDKFADTMHSEIRLLARTISAAMDGSAAAATPTKQRVKATVTREATKETPKAAAPKAPDPKESAAEGDYKMPEIKPKSGKKPALTAKRED